MLRRIASVIQLTADYHESECLGHRSDIAQQANSIIDELLTGGYDLNVDIGYLDDPCQVPGPQALQ